VSGSDASLYKKNILPVIFDGNVYTKGAQNAISGIKERNLGKVTDEEIEKINKMPVTEAVEKNFIADKNFDAAVNLVTEGGKIYLEISFDKNWLSQQKRNLVTTSSLTKAIVTGLPFENGDGSPLNINVDYYGNKRNEKNPSPGPFEIKSSGKQKIQVYPIQ
jgi:alpha-N-arabinofuranosidase